MSPVLLILLVALTGVPGTVALTATGSAKLVENERKTIVSITEPFPVYVRSADLYVKTPGLLCFNADLQVYLNDNKIAEQAYDNDATKTTTIDVWYPPNSRIWIDVANINAICDTEPTRVTINYDDASTPAPPTPLPPTPSPPTPLPPTPQPSTASPPTPLPPTPLPPTPQPPTDAPPSSPAPPTLAPATATPPTPLPPTAAPQTDVPATPLPPTPVPETPQPPSPQPPSPAPPTTVPRTPTPSTSAPPTQTPATAIPPTPMPETLQPLLPPVFRRTQKRIVTGTGAGATAATITGGAGPAMRLAAAASVCDPRDGVDPAERYSWFLSPLQLRVNGSHALGALVGNMLLAAAVAFLGWLLALVAGHFGRGTCPGLFGDLLDAQGLTKFPSLPLMAYQALYQGTAIAAMDLILYPPNGWEAAAGAAGVAGCVAVPVGVLRAVGYGVPQRAFVQRDPVRRHAAMRFFIGDAEWVSCRRRVHWVERWASVVRPYRQEAAWYGAVEYAAGFAVAAIQTAVPATLVGCGHQKLFTGLVFGILLGVELWVRPQLYARNRVLVVLFNAGQACAMFVYAAAYYRGSEGEELFDVAGQVLLGCIVVLGTKIVLDIIGVVLIFVSGRRRGLQAQQFQESGLPSQLYSLRELPETTPAEELPNAALEVADAPLLLGDRSRSDFAGGSAKSLYQGVISVNCSIATSNTSVRSCLYVPKKVAAGPCSAAASAVVLPCSVAGYTAPKPTSCGGSDAGDADRPRGDIPSCGTSEKISEASPVHTISVTPTSPSSPSFARDDTGSRRQPLQTLSFLRGATTPSACSHGSRALRSPDMRALRVPTHRRQVLRSKVSSGELKAAPTSLATLPVPTLALSPQQLLRTATAGTAPDAGTRGTLDLLRASSFAELCFSVQSVSDSFAAATGAGSRVSADVASSAVQGQQGGATQRSTPTSWVDAAGRPPLSPRGTGSGRSTAAATPTPRRSSGLLEELSAARGGAVVPPSPGDGGDTATFDAIPPGGLSSYSGVADKLTPLRVPSGGSSTARRQSTRSNGSVGTFDRVPSGGSFARGDRAGGTRGNPSFTTPPSHRESGAWSGPHTPLRPQKCFPVLGRPPRHGSAGVLDSTGGAGTALDLLSPLPRRSSGGVTSLLNA